MFVETSQRFGACLQSSESQQGAVSQASRTGRKDPSSYVASKVRPLGANGRPSWPFRASSFHLAVLPFEVTSIPLRTRGWLDSQQHVFIACRATCALWTRLSVWTPVIFRPSVSRPAFPRKTCYNFLYWHRIAFLQHAPNTYSSCLLLLLPLRFCACVTKPAV